MPDVHTQTLLTGSRIEDVWGEFRRLQSARRQRRYAKKKQSDKRMVERIVKATLQKQKNSPELPNVPSPRDANLEQGGTTAMPSTVCGRTCSGTWKRKTTKRC